MKSMAIGLFVVGICCAYQILAIYKVSTYVPENVSGLTTAIANMIIMSFGYVFHSIIGIIVNMFGNQKIAYTYGISFVPIMLILGIIGFLIICFNESKNSN